MQTLSLQAGRHVGSGAVSAERLLLTAGVPVLVLPVNPTEFRYRSVMIAWKDSREARQAVTNSLALLYEAEKVIVVAAQSYEDDRIDDGMDYIVQRLKTHGVAVEGERIYNGSEVDPL